MVERLAEGLAESQKRMLALVAADPHISKREMASKIGISTTAIDKNLATLKKKGFLKRVGPDKGGRWDILG